MNTKKILFIYGYGGSPKSKFCALIREAVPADKYEVVSYNYTQCDCSKAKAELEAIVKNEHIDLIIGTSLGGFITLCLDTEVKKIVLNPCMVPSVELPKLKPRVGHPEDVKPSDEMIATYKSFEESVYSGESSSYHQVIGLFGENDELLGTKYMESFRKAYHNALFMPGGHHGNAAAIPTIVKVIEETI